MNSRSEEIICSALDEMPDAESDLEVSNRYPLVVIYFFAVVSSWIVYFLLQ